MKTNKLFGLTFIVGIMLAGAVALSFTACNKGGSSSGSSARSGNMTWIPVADSTFGVASILGIAYGSADEAGSNFVAVGEGGTIAYSSDGANWTAVENNPFFDWSYYYLGFTINAITFGKNNFVAAGYGMLGYSTDGVTWGEDRSGTFRDSLIRGIAWGNDRFVAVGECDLSPLTLYSSDNGATWTIVTNNSLIGANKISSIAFGNGKFVAGGLRVGSNDNHGIAYSTDGATWTTASDSIYETFLAIAFGNGIFVAGGNRYAIAERKSYNGIVYSTDGVSWTAASDTTFVDDNILAIAYGGGRFIAGGSHGKMAYSTDGKSWTAITDTTFGESGIRSIAYGNNRFVAVGQNGNMAYADW